jgi:hypothetical protein
MHIVIIRLSKTWQAVNYWVSDLSFAIVTGVKLSWLIPSFDFSRLAGPTCDSEGAVVRKNSIRRVLGEM